MPSRYIQPLRIDPFRGAVEHVSPAPQRIVDAQLVSATNPYGTPAVAALLAELERRERDERLDRLDRLRALYLDSGMSLYAIGKAMGMKASSVAAQAARYGWVRMGGAA